MLVRILKAGAVATVLLVLSLNTQAELRLVTGNDYPPFAGQSLPDGGLSSQLVRAAFAAAAPDETVDIQFQPWTRGYRATLNSEYSATFPYVYTEQRATEMLFSDPFMLVDTVVISRATAPLDYHSPQDLAGKVLCQAQGWGLPQVIAEAVDAGLIEVVAVPQYASCFRMLLANRVDFLLSNNLQWVVQAQLNALDVSDFYLAGKPVQSTRHYLLAPQTQAGEAVIERFNRGLALLRQSGEYRLLIATYPALGPEYPND